MNKINLFAMIPLFFYGIGTMAFQFQSDEDGTKTNLIVLKKLPNRPDSHPPYEKPKPNKADLIAGTQGVIDYLYSYSGSSPFKYLLPKDVEEILHLHLAFVEEHGLLELKALDKNIEYIHPELLQECIARLNLYFESCGQGHTDMAKKLKKLFQKEMLPALIKMVEDEAKMIVGPIEKSALEDEGYEQYLVNHKEILAKRALEEARFREKLLELTGG